MIHNYDEIKADVEDGIIEFMDGVIGIEDEEE